jgi:outer membrane protein assembly factor BamB
VVIVLLQWLLRFGLPIVAPEAMLWAMLGGVAGGPAIVVWWLFFSRARWFDRVGAVALMVASVLVTSQVVHESIATGAQGMLLVLLAVPVLSLGLVAGAVVGRGLPAAPRRAAIAAAILAGCGALTLVRTGGFTGGGDNDIHWRWAPTPEERLLARAEVDLAALRPAPEAPVTLEDLPLDATREAPGSPVLAKKAEESPEEALEASLADQALVPVTLVEPVARVADWPGFRGLERNAVAAASRIETDWLASPPVEQWRRPIGPGWSSFAVDGDLVYTQEQRGDQEVVAAYRASTGEPVWGHADETRFWESNAGAGPRATPTLAGGRAYTFGATGIVNALDALDGAVVWSRDAGADTGREIPGWGFSGSPLVVGDVVIVAAAGSLVAYDRATGDPRWFGPKGGWGYSSPHLLTFEGVQQIVLLNGAGALGLAPGDGAVLWEHAWPGDGIVQPGVAANGDLLIGTGSGMGSGAEVGVRRLGVSRGADGWTVEPRWTSKGLKPYFNDFVVHQGHAFGFDGGILACIDLEAGERRWKGGRYGHGQLLLLPDQDLLLVLSERGELALVAAAPDRYVELARVPAIEGKTWNHPVLVGDLLLVRNGEEMAAFRLPAEAP